MTEKILKTTIKLRRDTINNYASHPDHIPLKGEVCIVDPTATSPWAKAKAIRFKIGDGATAWKNLKFYDEQNSSVLCGYLYNNKFYIDINHLQEVEELNSQTLYIDLHEGVIYYYDGIELKVNTAKVPNASATNPGIMKLYQKLGYNEDGTMSQKAITDAISSIKFTVDSTESDALDLLLPIVEEDN